MVDTSSLPRIAPETWPTEIAHLRDGFAGRLNVYRTMAHHPALLRSWAELRKHVVTENSLGPERLEIVILRVATRLGSEYEWFHHVARSEAIGLCSDRIQSISGPLSGMAGEDALIARSVDQLIDHSRLDPDDLSALTNSIGTKGVLDLMATVGFYKTLGCIAETFNVSLDDLE